MDSKDVAREQERAWHKLYAGTHFDDAESDARADLVKAFNAGYQAAIDSEQWVAVEDGLPEHEGRHYFITTVQGYVGTSMYSKDYPNGWQSIAQIIAWMPLPKPYKPAQAALAENGGEQDVPTTPRLENALREQVSKLWKQK